jgi:protein-S-isoprenylcysteine O-methyltransferase Ste14
MIYRDIHIVCWIIFFAYWLLNWEGNKKTIQRTDPRRRLAGFIVFIVLWVVLQRARGWPQDQIIPDNDAVQIAGAVCCAAGVALAIWARWILGTNWSANPTIKEGHELITVGPYRFVRHPIYTGILLALFGSLVLSGGRTGDLVLYALMVIGLHFKSKVEEGFMLQTFPEAYPAYRRRTKAIIPFVL